MFAMARKRSDVVWIMSDVIFPTFDVVFPTSNVLLGTFRREAAASGFARIDIATGVPPSEPCHNIPKPTPPYSKTVQFSPNLEVPYHELSYYV